MDGGHSHFFNIKTDGTLWAVGEADYGQLGDNTNVNKSSPIQIPGTNWTSITVGKQNNYATKSDNTFWTWGGNNDSGALGLNNRTLYSSPVQIPGSTWAAALPTAAGSGAGNQSVAVVKTDGTLWTWGLNQTGALGHNNRTQYSSPVQVPGTSWSKSYGNWTIDSEISFILIKEV